MNYDEGRLSLTSSHGIRISTLFDFIELFLLTFSSVANLLPFLRLQRIGEVPARLNDNFLAFEETRKCLVIAKEQWGNCGVYLCIFVGGNKGVWACHTPKCIYENVCKSINLQVKIPPEQGRTKQNPNKTNLTNCEISYCDCVCHCVSLQLCTGV